MNLTTIMRVIGRHKLLFITGLLVAALASFATAFRVETGSLTPRIAAVYRAPTQLLVSDPTSVFSTKNAPQEIIDGQTQPSARDLTSSTVVYAYLVTSGAILEGVEKKIGKLGKNESLSAQQRTTQPTATTNTGTYRLPILEIDGEATSPARAEEISRTAASVFQDFVAAQQDAAGVPAATRVQLQTIAEKDAEPVDGTNPALPIVAVGIGVLLAFLALIFAVDNARAARYAPRAPVSPSSPSRSGYPSANVPRPVMQGSTVSRQAAPPPVLGSRPVNQARPPVPSPMSEPASQN